MIESKIRAVDGGGHVRVCPVCEAEIEEEADEVQSDDPFYVENDIVSMTTVVRDDNLSSHMAEQH